MLDRSTAAEIHRIMDEVALRLDESVRLVQRRCTEEDLAQYRQAIGQVMGAILLDILQPMYRDHPEIVPPYLKSVAPGGYRAPGPPGDRGARRVSARRISHASEVSANVPGRVPLII